jgi:hypothetical protein
MEGLRACENLGGPVTKSKSFKSKREFASKKSKRRFISWPQLWQCIARSMMEPFVKTGEPNI